MRNSTLDDLSNITTESMSYIANGYLTALCIITGVPLNVFSIAVFCHRFYGSIPAIQYYLICLTVWQTALLCNVFVMYCLPTLIYGRVISKGFYVYLYPYVYTLANATHIGAIWVVLTLTIDRYLALCRPLTHMVNVKKGRVKRLMFGVSAVAVLYSVPRFFEVRVITECDEIFIDNLTDIINGTLCAPRVLRTDFAKNVIYCGVYHIVLAMLFVTLVPCLVLLILTLRISIVLRRAVIRRRSLCHESDEKSICTRTERKCNIMLVLVISKFLLSDLLPTVIDVLEQMIGGQAFADSSMTSLLVDLSNFLVVLNSSTNFWVFLIWGDRFRGTCKRMLFNNTITLRFIAKHDGDMSVIGTTGRTSARFTDASENETDWKLCKADNEKLSKTRIRDNECILTSKSEVTNRIIASSG